MDDKMTNMVPLMFVALLFAATASNGRAADETAPRAGEAPGAETVVPVQDANFMMKAANGGRAEVELAKLAMQRATSKSVKEHARRMLDDHEKANEKLGEIASRKNVPLPDQLTGVHRTLVEQLRAERQPDFDEAYMQAQVGEHKAAIALFRDEKNEGIDPALREFAASQLPVLERHLEEALKIADSVVLGGRDQDVPR